MPSPDITWSSAATTYFEYAGEYVHETITDLYKAIAFLGTGSFRDERLAWEEPRKERYVPIHIPEKKYQKMFTGIRFRIGGSKK